MGELVFGVRRKANYSIPARLPTIKNQTDPRPNALNQVLIN